MKREDKIILYTTESGNVTVSVRFEDKKPLRSCLTYKCRR